MYTTRPVLGRQPHTYRGAVCTSR